MKVLLDMDGPIADLHQSLCDLHKRPNAPFGHKAEDWGMTFDDFWNGVDRTFWQEIKPQPWAQELVSLMPRHWTICTCSIDKECRIGKTDWLIAHDLMPIIPPVFSCKKHRYATQDTLLIDDSPENVELFKKAGGMSILFDVTAGLTQVIREVLSCSTTSY